MNTKVNYLLITVFVMFLSLVSNGQGMRENNLLWEITGNGLTQPSYLFGTMHVRDPRAFNFSDEVMPSIEKCSAFALEVQPDSLIKSMFMQVFEEETDSTDHIKDLLSEEEYDKLKAAFKDKNSYGLDQVKSKNPHTLERLLKPDFSGEDDMNTFVDAYLYGVARTLKKEIYGLEDAKTQLDLLNVSTEDEERTMLLDFIESDEEVNKRFYDDFVKSYATGNLDLMFSKMGEKEIYNPVMIQRNKVMAESMIEIMHKEPLFAAMGVAHLLGNTSVIALLQYEGYTVKPVKSTFTGVADRYVIDPAKMEWATYKNELLGYEVEFPGMPIEVDIVESMESVIHPDMTTESYYFAYALDLRKIAGIEDDRRTMLERMLERVGGSRDFKVIKKKWITDKGNECLEATLKGASKKSAKVRFFIENDIAYSVYIETDLNQLKESYIKRVFESFTIVEPLPVIEKPSEWKKFTEERGAFSVMLPGEPEKITRTIPNPIEPEGEDYEVTLYMLTDESTMTNYILGFNDYPNKYYLENVNTSYESAYEELSSKGADLSPFDTVKIGGIDGRRTTLMIQDVSYTECRLLFRGNRFYRILKQNLDPNEKSLKDDPFFESFQLEPYKEATLETLEPEGGNFTMQVFEDQILEVDSTSVDHYSFLGRTDQYYFKNKNSGDLFSLEVSKLKKYFQTNHIDSFYNTMEEGVISYGDTILSKKSITLDGIPARELVIKNIYRGNVSRDLFFLHGDYLYYIVSYASEYEIFDESSNRFFSSFKKKKQPPSLDIYAPKAKLIIDNLTNKDTLEQVMAMGALNYYDFEKKEIPLLQKALESTFPDDTSSLETRLTLIILLGEFDDSSVAEILKAEYQKPNQNDKIKEEILDFFNVLDDGEKLAVFLDLFLNDPPKEADYAHALFWPFRDSIALAAQYYDQLLPFLTNDNYRNNVLSLARNLVQEDTLNYKSMVANSFETLTKYANTDLENFKKEKEEDPDTYYCGVCNSYLYLMQAIKDQSITEAYTKSYLECFNENYQQAEAVYTRIVNGLKVDKKLAKSLLVSNDTRLQIIEAYQKTDNLAAVSSKYLEEEAIASLVLSTELEYDYGDPDKMILLGSIDTEKGKFYVYEFEYEHYMEKGTFTKYRAVVGYFNDKVADLDFDKLYSYSDWEEDVSTDWKTHAQEMIADFD